MRVLTWNLWWRFGDWRARREAIAAVLAEVRPDVLGLQEVWAHGPGNLAGWLAARLGRETGGAWHWAWAAERVPERWWRRIEPHGAAGGPAGGPGWEVGNAVVSRWPIAERAVLRLPVAGGRDNGRLALYALVDAPGARVPFFTAHLNAAAHESAVRRAQVAALAEFVAERGGGGADGAAGPFPPVVTGDFNAPPESDELRLLGGLLTAPAVAGQVLRDAWSYADPAAPSATWDRANPHVAARLEPSARLDYIHVGPPGPGGLGAVRSVRRVGAEPVRGPRGPVWPSDHAAVTADLWLRAPGAVL
ncbi:endonuclease [Streptomyces albus subsp. albus]|nr:endonuclease [Streptomyces albus subsp. albus]